MKDPTKGSPQSVSNLLVWAACRFAAIQKQDPPHLSDSKTTFRPKESPRILVTAGPTWEPIDEVRYLGNRSSGQMGLEIATATAMAGCPTTLLRGPATRAPTSEITDLTQLRFESARDLESLIHVQWPNHDILVMAAAVADFRPKRQTETPAKIRRNDGPLALNLEPVPDILAGLATKDPPGRIRIGFALEPPESLIDSAKEKLRRKSLSGIIANPISTLDSEVIDATYIHADGRTERAAPGPIPKSEFAQWLANLLHTL